MQEIPQQKYFVCRMQIEYWLTLGLIPFSSCCWLLLFGEDKLAMAFLFWTNICTSSEPNVSSMVNRLISVDKWGSLFSKRYLYKVYHWLTLSSLISVQHNSILFEKFFPPTRFFHLVHTWKKSPNSTVFHLSKWKKKFQLHIYLYLHAY